jgi:hypothetical protein
MRKYLGRLNWWTLLAVVLITPLLVAVDCAR